jgi:hypothetical protein
MQEDSRINFSQHFAAEERKSLKVLIFFYAVFILCAIFGFGAEKILKIQIMENWQFGAVVIANLFLGLLAAAIATWSKKIFFAKYLLFIGTALMVTLEIIWTGSAWAFLGYYLLVLMATLFNSRKLSFFAGIISIIFFAGLINTFYKTSPSEIVVWFAYFLPGIAIAVFINNKNRLFITQVVKRQEEVEDAKTVLEIRVRARTRELRELADSLEAKVVQRTGELEGKIKELERILNLTVGREMKMIELKKRIKGLEIKSGLKKREGAEG